MLFFKTRKKNFAEEANENETFDVVPLPPAPSSSSNNNSATRTSKKHNNLNI